MSEYYKGKRTRNLYDPKSTEPFSLSRSKIDLYIECPRCFYIDRRLGVGRPPGFPFAINSAVDKLLKQEFDIHRAKGSAHPLMEKYGLDAVPAQHPNIDVWRENFKGVQYLHKPTNLNITGAIDDLWQGSDGKYMVVDYKATSKDEEITELNKGWQDGYKRQMEIYQWLLRKNDLDVSDTGYFVYCNGRTDRAAFDGRIDFDITLIAYKGSDTWIPKTLTAIHKALQSASVPDASVNCDYCLYRNHVDKVLS